MSVSSSVNPSSPPKLTLFSVAFSVGDLHSYASYLLEQVKTRSSAFSVLPATMNEMMSVLHSRAQAEKIAAFDEVIPDGMPLVWLQKLKGASSAQRLYGPDLLQKVCEVTQDKHYSHYFFGGTPESLSRLISRLRHTYPKLKIVGYQSPSFNLTSEETLQEIKKIQHLNPDFIWVGLGGEKQVNWIWEVKPLLTHGCLLAVGAAFDFVGGSKHQAPVWMRNNGFEWLYRLLSEPRRLWRRYILQIPPFIIFCIFEAFKKPSLVTEMKERS